MAISSWNAGIIRPIPVAPAGPYQNGAAKGVWTLDQVAYWQKQGLWPIAGNIDPANRGLFSGFLVAADTTNVIEYISIASTGNATDFGDLSVARRALAACASSTRGVFAGGKNFNSSVPYNVIDYVTIATTGNATDFGDLLAVCQLFAGLSNSTRGIFAGGSSNEVDQNVIQYITIASAGNAIDFGDMSYKSNGLCGCASTTRGVIAGGYTTVVVNNIEYVTIASTGNSTDFGDLLTNTMCNFSAGASSTRAVFGGGIENTFAAAQNVIQYITIASTGNATDFGDLTVGRCNNGAASSSLRVVFAGGTALSTSTRYNVMDYVTVASTGNATDFGDLTSTSAPYTGGCSNAHGGL